MFGKLTYIIFHIAEVLRNGISHPSKRLDKKISNIK